MNGGPGSMKWDAIGTIFPNLIPKNDRDGSRKLALIVLRCNLSQDLMKEIYENSSLRIFADGGSNDFYNNISEEDRERYLPDCIVGDMDSIQPEVLEYYKSKNVEILKSDCAYTTDFEKCLVYLHRFEELKENHNPNSEYLANSYETTRSMPLEPISSSEDASSPERYEIVTLCSTRGRLDQSIGIINALLILEPGRLAYLIMGSNIVLLLRKGEHTIEYLNPVEGPYCGIIPLTHELLKVQTKGLVWNITYDNDVGFGSFISTNNLLDLKQHPADNSCSNGDIRSYTRGSVEVTTSGNLVWMVSFDHSRLKAFKGKYKVRAEVTENGYYDYN